MAQQLKMLAAKPDELSLIPETHTVERELIPAKFPDLHMHSTVHMCTHTQSINKCNKFLSGMILRMKR